MYATADPRINAAFHRVFWGAIFAGVVVALVVQLLLNLLGAGIGAAVIDPASSYHPRATSLSISTGVWFVVKGIIALFIARYIASRLSGRPVRTTGALHGVIAWAVTTVVVIHLRTTSVVVLIGGVFSGLGGIVSSTGSTVRIIKSECQFSSSATV